MVKWDMGNALSSILYVTCVRKSEREEIGRQRFTQVTLQILFSLWLSESVNYFPKKKSIIDVWHGCKYTSSLLSRSFPKFYDFPLYSKGVIVVKIAQLSHTQCCFRNGYNIHSEWSCLDLSSGITPCLQIIIFAKGYVNFQLEADKTFVAYGTMVKI